jgi:hypothetical protein
MNMLGPAGRLFAIALAAALIVSVLWDAWQSVSVRTTTLAGAPLLQLANERLSDRATTINGSTALPAKLSLVSQGLVLARSHTTGPLAPADTQFSFDVRPYAKSAYGLSVVAETHEGPFFVHDDRSVEILHDRPRSSARPVAPRSFRRELWVHVSYERLRYNAKLTFAHDDPFAGAFVSGAMPLKTFLDLTLPRSVLSTTDVALSDIVLPRTQNVVVTPSTVTIRIAGDSAVRGGESVPIGERIQLTMRSGEFEAFNERAHPDTIHMQIDGYILRDQSPLPAQRNAGGFSTWYPSASAPETDIVSTLEPALAPGLGKLRRALAPAAWEYGPLASLAAALAAVFSLAPPLIALFVLAPGGVLLEPSRRKLHSALLSAMLAAPLVYSASRLVQLLLEQRFDLFGIANVCAAAAATLGLLAAWILMMLRLPGGADRRSALITMSVAVFVTALASALGATVSPYDPLSFLLGPVLSLAVLVSFVRPDLLLAVVLEHWPRAARWATLFGAVAMISVALNVPVQTLDHALGVHLLDTLLTTEFSATRLAAAAIVVSVLFAGLYTAGDWNWQKMPYAIAALWAAYVIGASTSVLTLPLALALGVFSFRWIALVGSGRREKMENIRAAIKTRTASKSGDFATMRDLEQLDDTLARLHDRLLSGDLKPDDFASYQKRLEADRVDLKAALQFPDAVRSPDIAFSFGVDVDPWRNGIAAAKAGAVLALVLFAFGAPVLIDRSTVPLFTAFTSIVEVFASRIAGAFLFGYFFAYVRGTMGVTKALAFTTAAVAASLPVWVLVDSRENILSGVVSLLFFYGLIGAWFDVHGWKTVGRTNLREVFTLAGLGNFAALGTLGVTALAAVVTGQIQQIFQVLLKAVENQIKTGP